MISDSELAFAENLILLGATPGPRLIYPLLLRQHDARPLWDLVQALQLVQPQVIQEARSIADEAIKAIGPQAFSFSEGAMVGSWELIARRGAWVGGEVWFATQPGGMQATLRLISPGSGRDEERQVRFVERSNAGLDPPHPSVLKVDEAQEDFGWLYAATLNMDCQPLCGLREQGPLDERTAVALAQSLAGSLSVVHGLGVVHGGLNPLGVLVRGQRTYLSDFGFCSALLDGPVAGCRPGGRLGSLLFSSPGLVLGDANRGLDGRDDLYSLGALVYYAVCSVGAADHRAPPDAPWAVEPPVSDGLKTILGRLLAVSEEARYPDPASLQEDLQRLAHGGLPGPLPPATAVCRGRRAPTAQPQSILTAEILSQPMAPGPMPVNVDVVPVEVVHDPGGNPLEKTLLEDAEMPSGEYEEYEDDEYEDDDEAPRKHFDAPVKRKKAAKRFQESQVTEAKKGGGWILFAVSLILVLGGLVLAHLLTQPQGADLGRAHLATAFELIQGDEARYGEALALVDASVPLLTKAPDRVRSALALRDRVEQAALDARLAILPDGMRAKREVLDQVHLKLLDLSKRSEGCQVHSLLQYDLARRDDKVDNNRWGHIGEALLMSGQAAEAADAFQRCGRKDDRDFAALAARSMVFLRGGPYLLPAKGEGGKESLSLVTRKPCYVGKTEVTRASYARFLRAIANQKPSQTMVDGREPEGKKHHDPVGWDPKKDTSALPATGLDFFDAVAYADWRGLKLADEATLLVAARGPLGLRYPWGETNPDLTHANLGNALQGLAPVGCIPGGTSPSGALDLVGNAAEWVWQKTGTKAPLFGGSYATKPEDARAASAEPLDMSERPETAGFRVMKVLGEKN